MIRISPLEKIRTLSVVLSNLFLGSSVTSLALFPKPRRMVEYVQTTLFYYKAVTSNGLPNKNIQDLFQISADSVTLQFCNLDKGWFKIDPSYTKDIFSLCLICQLLKPKVIFEIGTLNGYTARHFALNTDANATIYTLDLPYEAEVTPKLNMTVVDKQQMQFRKTPGKMWFAGKPEEVKIHRLYGDSATLDFTPFYGKVDFFFIDGAHSYDYVRCDTLSALKCCHSGSLIAWHDYGRIGVNGVSRWLHHFAKSRSIYRIPGSSTAFMRVD